MMNVRPLWHCRTFRALLTDRSVSQGILEALGAGAMARQAWGTVSR
jgi:hypothetical protein